MSLTTERAARFNLRVSLVIALAVFAQESVWNFYDAQVPALLRAHLTSAALIGLLMGLDNVIGVFVQPWMGNRSDRTRTRFGRRLPYLLVGAPVAAIAFTAIPWAGSLPVLIAVMLIFAVTINAYKPICESLVPDFIAPANRSKAYGILKAATSLTIIVSALISLLVIDEHPRFAFVIPAALMIVAVAIVALTIRERESDGYRQAAADDADSAAGSATPRQRLWAVVTDLVRDPDRRRLFILAIAFCTGAAWSAMRALLTPYGTDVLGLTRGQAGALTLPGGIAFLLAAVPLAILSDRYGRHLMMKLGLALLAASLLLGFAVQTATMTKVAIGLASIGYAAFVINAVVVLWSLASSSTTGAHTGLYAVAVAGGSALGPALIGALVDLTGWGSLLLYSAMFAAVALVLLLRTPVPAAATAASTAASTASES
jgi:Na+/melibiose symporter-like transporter